VSAKPSSRKRMGSGVEVRGELERYGQRSGEHAGCVRPQEAVQRGGQRRRY
jgi:hypothetical protein